MAHVNSSEFSHAEEIARRFTHKSQQNNHTTHVLSLHMAVRAPNDSNYDSCPQNASHNREQWRHRAPPATPEAKKYRKKQGQGGGFTKNFRATPAPCWPHLLSFLSSSHRSFFGPQLFLSGHIGPFFGPHLFFSGNISPFLGHNFTFQVTLVLFLGHIFSFRATSVF